MARAKPSADSPLKFAAPIYIDSRENLPWTFEGLRADAVDHYRPLIVETKVIGLPSGDYSVEGYLTRVACERKNLADLFSTLSQGRDRFERELERLAEYDYAAVVVEADWAAILNSPPAFTKLSPKIVYRSVIAWQQRYLNIHWWMCPDRRFAEITTFRILQRYYQEKQKELGPTE